MKRTIKHILFLVSILLYINQIRAQTGTLDSIKYVLSQTKNDTARVNRINSICFLLITTARYKESDSLLKIALAASEKINYKNGDAGVLVNFAYLSNKLGDYAKSIQYYSRAKAQFEELGDSLGIARVLNRMGDDYWALGNFPVALELEFNAQRIFEKYHDKKGESLTDLSLGNILGDLGDNDNAIQYYNKGLKLAVENQDKDNVAAFLGDIGDSYQFEKKFQEATDYSQKSLKLNTEIGDKEGMVDAIDNMGEVYFQQGNDTAAIRYYLWGLTIAEEIGSKQRIADNLVDLGKTYQRLHNLGKAIEYASKGVLLSRQIGALLDLRDGEQALSIIYEDMHNTQQAYWHYKTYRAVCDTLSNQDNTRKMTRSEMKLEYEKQQALAKAEQDKKDAVVLADKRKQQIIIISVSIGLLLVIAFSGLLFSRFRITQKQNRIIELQKEEVEKKNMLIEEKNKDILASITYAKRLQDAILPPLSIIKQYLPESFLLYKPKDIVAGDFYWMEHSGDNILIAAADCTGHGVPGALVSVVCSNALNRTVKEFQITEPGKILDKVRELVLETFEKSESKVQDGMDISLCCINTKTKEVQWSGAYNSLWYIQNGEIKEVAADKQPIGKHDQPKPFHTHKLNLQKGDTLYLFTDGYADQFGGPNGKKFKYKQMEELLLANAAKPMDEQSKVLEGTLEKWKGALEQVDDILIIGIRV